MVRVGGHDVPHVAPPMLALRGLGDGLQAGLVFDFRIGEELAGLGMEEDGVVVDPDGIVVDPGQVPEAPGPCSSRMRRRFRTTAGRMDAPGIRAIHHFTAFHRSPRKSVSGKYAPTRLRFMAAR